MLYPPPSGGAKDPVNFAGMVGADILRGDMPVGHWSDAAGAFLLDARDADGIVEEPGPGCINIPQRGSQFRGGTIFGGRFALAIRGFRGVLLRHGRSRFRVCLVLPRQKGGNVFGGISDQAGTNLATS